MWHEARRPAGFLVRFTQAAQSVHEPSEPGPSKAPKASVLESADHGLVDAAQVLELPLRQAEPTPPSQHQLPKQLEAALALRIGVRRVEQRPGHSPTMRGGPYLALGAQMALGAQRSRGGVPLRSMQLNCIFVRHSSSGTPSATDMQSSYIKWGGSFRTYATQAFATQAFATQAFATQAFATQASTNAAPGGAA
jgi:hypothetical protein